VTTSLNEAGHRKLSRRRAFGIALSSWPAYAASSGVTPLVDSMEARYGVRIFTGIPANGHLIYPVIAPDGGAMCWVDSLLDAQAGGHPGDPFLRLSTVEGGVRALRLDGQNIFSCIATCDRCDVIIIKATGRVTHKHVLLMLVPGKRITIHDLTASLGDLELSEVERGSLSSNGSRLALGSPKRVQVIDLPRGKPIFSSVGRFPRLSPDGALLAYVSGGRLLVRSLASGNERQYLPGVRAMGVGQWSPDGQFLPAGAWTRVIALDKRLVIVDMNSGRYDTVSALGDGDYGTEVSWISTKLPLPGQP
jgi:hypothetical protein